MTLIGWTRDGTSATAEIKAYVRGSSIQADALRLSATAHETINATVLAGSVAIGGGGGVGIGESGAGVETTNRIASHVKAFIDGDGANGIHAGQISITALDSSSISADAGAASVAASFGGGAGVSISVGVALAYNEIANQVEAYVLDADQVEATAGAVALLADDHGSITARTGAASLSAAVGGGGGIAASGAGAEATNVILTTPNVFIQGTHGASTGDLQLAASDTSGIGAIVATASAAVGAAGGVGVGASIGASLAQNLIGFTRSGTRTPAQVRAYVKNSSIDAGGDLVLTATANESIAANVFAGSAAIGGGGGAGIAASGSGRGVQEQSPREGKGLHPRRG